jgi:hypothetical protein
LVFGSRFFQKEKQKRKRGEGVEEDVLQEGKRHEN